MKLPFRVSPCFASSGAVVNRSRLTSGFTAGYDLSPHPRLADRSPNIMTKRTPWVAGWSRAVSSVVEKQPMLSPQRREWSSGTLIVAFNWIDASDSARRRSYFSTTKGTKHTKEDLPVREPIGI